ncbi:MAG TPA: hypothetical protein VML19_27980 [Verrucomicrobiae bacterium]|nr:hypothetical protein [Verrucomicrobiae bacterium]
MPSHVQNGSVSADDVRQQVEKILRSGEFSGSEVLRNLLAFLSKHSLENPGEVVKEYELAIGVLGRPEGFDPRLDSAVRVHTARLRAKLAEYYMSDGSEDAILIEVPKGSYHLAWRQRGIETVPHPEPVEARVAAGTLNSAARKWFAAGAGAAAIAILVGFGIWTLARSAPIPRTVETFWKPFLQSAQPPIVVFSNHRFAGSSATGLHPFREGVDAPSDINDTYSGTGTVMAVGELSNLFSLSGRPARLKRAELLTWDEARDANVVFVGAPEANSRLKEMAPLEHFAFKSSNQEPQFGTGAVINLHPAAGEQSMYFGSARPFTFDYAVIALLPNLRPERMVLILAGTNTYGCQAAAEFVMRPDLLQALAARLGVASGRPFPEFEALLKVDVSGGVPVRPQLLAVRLHKTPAAGK